MFRDTSAWYHIVLACDTTQATASNRLKLYVNGVQETLLSNGYTYRQNADTWIICNYAHEIGNDSSDYYAEFFSGYMADMHLVDGHSISTNRFW